MSSPGPAQYAEAFASWRADAPIPDAPETRLTLQATLSDLAGTDLDVLGDEARARTLPTRPDDDVALIAVRLHRQDRPRPATPGPNRVPPDVPAD
ncbi:Putative PAS/PAC sensor protein [Modestobacter italicus]|uniref:PAS/PAC sensor protein n=1 Tax=Modestobacter italicus (strain DSM 44449 / CECT 9708 / BC 501) TaxID=2732864 RepID=I4F0P7_MODI5|nr:hypothetical protein [Modestobacter marinus]CCH89210.1 Putative PAS/PAC sensor protein [Modestobacter marinus]